MVIDAGGLLPNGEDQGQRVVVPYLRARGIQTVDLLLLTHSDADHIGGAATLLERFPIRLLLDNGLPTPLVKHTLALAAQQQTVHRIGCRGQRLDFGDGVTGRILSPSDRETHGSDNEASLVLRLDYGRTSFLFTGDAGAEAEKAMLRAGQPLAADVLKVGHHGSRSSTTEPFLAAVRPRFAVLSAGKNNVYGHPSPLVMERLLRAGVRCYRTDKQGAITFFSNGRTLSVEPP